MPRFNHIHYLHARFKRETFRTRPTWTVRHLQRGPNSDAVFSQISARLAHECGFFLVSEVKQVVTMIGHRPENIYCMYVSLYLRISEVLSPAYIHAALDLEARINGQALTASDICLLPPPPPVALDQ